jgi:isopentenyl phosphate kinase
MNLVKFGGSIITTKGAGKRVRSIVLRRLAREVAGGDPTIVLHGAGSFGHTLARKAHLKEGLKQPAQWHAASEVSADVRTLHLAVLRALHGAKARPYSLPPGQLAFASGGHLGGLALAPFQLALAQGFLPVACGDVVLDDKQGVAIVSADTIAQHLAQRLEVTRVVFATDVDGIYTSPPGSPGAELILRCTPDELREVRLGASAKTDVTGGMAGKGQAIAAIAETGADVWVVNGLRAGRVQEALQGKAPRGTLVTIKP